MVLAKSHPAWKGGVQGPSSLIHGSSSVTSDVPSPVPLNQSILTAAWGLPLSQALPHGHSIPGVTAEGGPCASVPQAASLTPSADQLQICWKAGGRDSCARIRAVCSEIRALFSHGTVQ